MHSETKCRQSKGQWTPAQDSVLVHLVETYGQQQWSRIATYLPGRRGKQCRERWQNHLRPDIKREGWSSEEEWVLVELHQQYGNKWAQFARRLPGRPENAIKNHWNATLRRKNRRKPHKLDGSPCVLDDYIQKIDENELLKKTTTTIMMVSGSEESSSISNNEDGEERLVTNIYDGEVDQHFCAAAWEAAPPSHDLLQDVVGMAAAATLPKELGRINPSSFSLLAPPQIMSIQFPTHPPRIEIDLIELFTKTLTPPL